MLKKAVQKTALPLFASFGVTAAVLLLRQKVCLTLANRHADDTPHIIYKTDGISVAYEVQGHGSPIVLLHSMHLGASRREWRPQIENLAKEYRVYSIDMVGYGQSDKPQKPWTAYQYAIFLHQFLTDVVNSPVVVAAANGGADIALVLSMLYPTDIKKMILISPEGIGQGFATPQDTEPLKKLLLPVAGTQIFLDSTTKKCIKRMAKQLFWQTERMPVDFVENLYHNARYGKGAKISFVSYRTRFFAADTRRAFSELSIPFLLIWGEKNEINPIQYLEQAEAMQDKGEFLLFEDTASLPHLENPKAFYRIMIEFLK